MIVLTVRKMEGSRSFLPVKTWAALPLKQRPKAMDVPLT